jgi:hypothetical protein
MYFGNELKIPMSPYSNLIYIRGTLMNKTDHKNKVRMY